ncbi:MAG: hypothetical protein J3K34DRAFT_413745 [Monoraphidium minutum]|nr:MAG: hypothetical protein J3K34DRAFT_413745 [Monoraphidium minutum]
MWAARRWWRRRAGCLRPAAGASPGVWRLPPLAHRTRCGRSRCSGSAGAGPRPGRWCATDCAWCCEWSLPHRRTDANVDRGTRST